MFFTSFCCVFCLDDNDKKVSCLEQQPFIARPGLPGLHRDASILTNTGYAAT